MSPLDLHVLGTPPAFVLSQDQTLPFNPFSLELFPVLKLNSLESLALLIALLFYLYRFQGSVRRSRKRLIIISPNLSFVKLFLKLF